MGMVKRIRVKIRGDTVYEYNRGKLIRIVHGVDKYWRERREAEGDGEDEYDEDIDYEEEVKLSPSKRRLQILALAGNHKTRVDEAKNVDKDIFIVDEEEPVKKKKEKLFRRTKLSTKPKRKIVKKTKGCRCK
jgi:hypothetical protein